MRKLLALLILGGLVACGIAMGQQGIPPGAYSSGTGGSGGGSAFPVTVTGGVSGAVPCFTSTTTESAGTLLATNALVIGGGAGVCPNTGNGDFTYATHTLTMGAAGLFDMSASTVDNSFKVPLKANPAAAANASIWQNNANGAYFGGQGGTGNFAFATSATNNNITTTCTNQVLTAISSGPTAPTCSTLTGSFFATLGTASNCSAVGTAASPSVASCGSSAAGQFSCATNATGATCQINTTAVTANSEIFVFESDTAVTGTRLGVTCNTGTNVLPASRLLASSVAATSFTINLGTVTTNPACFSYEIIN